MVSCGILYVGAKIPTNFPTWKSLISSIGSLGLASVAISIIWEFFQKRGFTQELLEYFHLSENLHESGIEKMSYRFDEVDWKLLFDNCLRFDLFITYGRSWRGTNETRLIEIAKRTGAIVRIVLPDPENGDLVKQFATRYRKSQPEIKGLIEEAIKDFKKFMGGREASFELKVTDRPPTNTYYRFNDRMLVTLYNYNDEKGNIPVFLLKKGGRMTDFFEFEFEYLWKTGIPK